VVRLVAVDPQVQLSFLHAILSDPEDDAPRLVYADWLQDQGDPLGELVRVQAELARIDVPHARRAELTRRERELLDGLGFDRPGRTALEIDYDGLDALPGEWNFAVRDGVPLLFITGLLPDRTLPVPPQEWIDRFGWYVIRIGFYDSYEYRYELDDDVFRALLDSPLMERCIGLDLNDVQRSNCAGILAKWPGASRLLQLRLREAGCSTELLTSPHLSGLVELDVSKNYLDADDVLALAGSCAATDLRRLRLPSCSRDVPAAIAALANSPRLSRLRLLDLSNNHLDTEAIRALAEATGLENLVDLDVSSNEDFRDAEALALIRSPRLPRLRRLHLEHTSIGTATVAALCESDRFLRCGVLSLWDCSVTDESLAVLAASPPSSCLLELLAGYSPCGDVTAKALAGSPHLRNLRKLNLSGCRLGPEGAEALTAPDVLPNLLELRLSGNALGDRGVFALARWAHQRGDTELLLWDVGLTAAGLADLAESGCLAGVTKLELSDNILGDEGAAVLARCADLRTLRQLWLSNAGVTDVGASALIASPNLSRECRVLGLWSELSEPVKAALHQRFARP
jgi:uncharacterized protein (TIGR02996 family)